MAKPNSGSQSVISGNSETVGNIVAVDLYEKKAIAHYFNNEKKRPT